MFPVALVWPKGVTCWAGCCGWPNKLLETGVLKLNVLVLFPWPKAGVAVLAPKRFGVVFCCVPNRLVFVLVPPKPEKKKNK